MLLSALHHDRTNKYDGNSLAQAKASTTKNPDNSLTQNALVCCSCATKLLALMMAQYGLCFISVTWIVIVFLCAPIYYRQFHAKSHEIQPFGFDSAHTQYTPTDRPTKPNEHGRIVMRECVIWLFFRLIFSLCSSSLSISRNISSALRVCMWICVLWIIDRMTRTPAKRT